MQEYKLSELRDMYPDIKATSKIRFIELVKEQEASSMEVILDEEKEVAVEEVKLGKDELTWKTIIDYIVSESKSTKKILIKVDTSFDADFLFNYFKEKLFPILEANGTMLMASSTRRDMHINGSCYCRLVCKNNYEHKKRLIAYNTFKTVV